MTDHAADTTNPSGRWEFDEDVTSCFDDMLERSIPGYHDMRRLVTRLAERFIVPGTDIVDLGASRGQAVAPLIDHFGDSVTWHLVEVSGSMLTALKGRFAVTAIGPADRAVAAGLQLRGAAPHPAKGTRPLGTPVLCPDMNRTEPLFHLQARGPSLCDLGGSSSILPVQAGWPSRAETSWGSPASGLASRRVCTQAPMGPGVPDWHSSIPRLAAA